MTRAALAAAAALLSLAAPPGAAAPRNVTVLGTVPFTNHINGMFVQDDRAYFINNDSGVRNLRIYDTSDPTSPALLSAFPVSLTSAVGDMHSVYVSNGLAYVGLRFDPTGEGLYIVDVRDPRAPALVSFTHVEGGVHNLRLAGSHVFILPDDPSVASDIVAYDVSDPVNPVLSGSWDLSPGSSYCHDLSVMNGVGYASMWEDGVYLLDVTAPGTMPWPVIANTAGLANTHSAWPMPDFRHVVTCHEDLDVGLNVWDLTAPQPAPPIATWQSHEGAATDTIVHDVMVIGRFAYVTYYGEGLRILDLADPANPVEVGAVPLPAFCFGFCGAYSQWVEDGLIYYLDQGEALVIASFDLPHDAPITLQATKAVADVAIGWNHTGESQYTVRTRAAKQTMAGLVNRDVDGATSFRDPGAVPGAPGVVYYTINGAWR